MNSQTEKFEERKRKAEEARKKKAQNNNGKSSEESVKKPNKKTNDLSEIGNIVDDATLTEQQSNTGDTEMADNKEEKVDMGKLVEEWKAKNPDMAEFMKSVKGASFMLVGKDVAPTGFNMDDFNKWKADKQDETAKSEKSEEKKKEEKDNSEEKPAANDNEPENVGLSKKEGAKEVPEAEWVKKMDNHWKNWCEDRDPKYVYERDTEKPGYAFKYYKTNEDKTANKPAVEAHYENEGAVQIKTSDGKAADLEFWKGFADAAKKNDQVVNFERMSKTDNKSRLYLACVLQGVDVKNANVAEMNFEESFKTLTDEEKKIAQAALGLDENGAKIAKEGGEQEKPKEEVKEEPKEEVKEEPKIEKYSKEKWDAKEVNVAKDRIAELRKVIEGRQKDKDGNLVYDNPELQKYQDGKATARKKMEEDRDASKDMTKTAEERKASKDGYDKTKATLIQKVLDNKQK